MTPEELKQKLEELKAKQADDIKAAVDAQKAANEAKSAELSALIEEQKTAIAELKGQLNELEVKNNDQENQPMGLAKSLSDGLKRVGDGAKSLGSAPIYIGLKATNDKEAEAEFKAAADFTVPGLIPTAANIPWLTTTTMEAGLNEAPKVKQVILDYVDMGSTGSRTIMWSNKINVQGNAAFIGEGVLKPLRSFQIGLEQSVAKKEAVRYRTSTETLEDRPTFLSELRTDGFEELRRQLSTAVLSGTESSTSIGGIIGEATAYNLTTVEGEDPDNYGAIRAAVAQIVSLNFTPNAVLVNPIDAANMDLKKGTNGQYVMPPFATVNGQNVAGLPVVESNEIAVGYLLVGDFKKYHVRMYLGPRLDIGTDGNDFSENMRTVIVEQRLHAYVKSVDAGAFLYDTFANIKTAITPVAA